MVLDIGPTMVGLMVAVGVIRASGALDFASDLLGNISELIHIPSEIIPVIIVRLFSTSAANGLVFDLFKEYGTDSLVGALIATMAGVIASVVICYMF